MRRVGRARRAGTSIIDIVGNAEPLFCTYSNTVAAPMLLLLATLLGLCSAIEDVTFIGTQITCPCKLGCGFCRTRSVEVFEFRTDLASNTTTEPVS